MREWDASMDFPGGCTGGQDKWNRERMVFRTSEKFPAAFPTVGTFLLASFWRSWNALVLFDI
jgi:hypothetical protein